MRTPFICLATCLVFAGETLAQAVAARSIVVLEERLVEPAPGVDVAPALSGDRFVFETRRAGGLDIALQDGALFGFLGSQQTAERTPRIDGDAVVWSVDNNTILFRDISADFSGATLNVSVSPTSANVEPDVAGEFVIWLSDVSGTVDLYFWNSRTRLTGRLAATTGFDRDASISGEKVVWVENSLLGEQQLLSVSLLDGFVQVLDDSSAFILNPSLSNGRAAYLVGESLSAGVLENSLIRLVALSEPSNNQVLPLPMAARREVVLDGSLLYYDEVVDGFSAIFVYDLDQGGPPLRLPLRDDASADYFLSDAEGTQVAFVTNRTDDLDVGRLRFRFNTVPQVNAGADAFVLLGESFSLLASATDGDDEPIAGYAWQVLARPSGSVASLSDPTVAAPTFTPDQAGVYEFAVTASDGFADSNPDTVILTAVDLSLPQSLANGLNVVSGRPVDLPFTLGSDLAAAEITDEGTLPPGLDLVNLGDGNWALRGQVSPEEEGSYAVTLSVQFGGLELVSAFSLNVVPLPVAQQAYLKAGNTDAGDGLGGAVAFDGNTLVVGASFEDGDGSSPDNDQANAAGAAYVFFRDPGGQWSQQAYLKASNAASDDGFGGSVAVAGDTLVVGALLEDSAAIVVNGDQSNDSAFGAGAAYVFVRDGAGVWTQQAYLKASNAGLFDNFGASVAIAGETIVVGAPGEASQSSGVDGDPFDNTAGGAGAAYVFVREASLWTQQAYLKAPNPEGGTGIGNPGDRFGQGVAIDGETIVVGANGEDSDSSGVNGDPNNNFASNSGAAYVFVRDGSGWSQQAYLKASHPGLGDSFGESVDVAGETIVVGASRERSAAVGVNGDPFDNSSLNAGAAYVFIRDTAGTWTQQAYLKASQADAGGNFGTSVSVDGDLIAVGAPNERVTAVGVAGDPLEHSFGQAGVAYLFNRNLGSWTQMPSFQASSPGENDRLGTAIALSGTTVAVSAPGEDSAATTVNGDQSDDSAAGSGAVYVFALLLPELQVVASTPLRTEVLLENQPRPLVFPANLFSPQTATLTLSNVGRVPLELTGTSVGSPLSLESVTLPLILAPGESLNLTLLNEASSLSDATTDLVVTFSNTRAEDPNFDGQFTATVYAPVVIFGADDDEDGLNNEVELQLFDGERFDYRVSEPEAAADFWAAAGRAGLISEEALEAIIAKPVITRDPATGEFVITIRLSKSTDLNLGPAGFDHLRFDSGTTSVNAEGDLEFRFTSEEDAAFFIQSVF